MIAVNNYIIVRKDSDALMKGGILLPSFRERNGEIGFPFSGVVESVGEKVSGVCTGDRIVFDDLCSPWIIDDADNGSLILIMKDTDIICILNGQ